MVSAIGHTYVSTVCVMPLLTLLYRRSLVLSGSRGRRHRAASKSWRTRPMQPAVRKMRGTAVRNFGLQIGPLVTSFLLCRSFVALASRLL
ncbi:hypothetical protein C8Q73DRAFT_458975 [Cubamyces lactineus]|nr:hypothetical protein C8Q73DRAFT_458975 [Cubamyces lactineus]